MPFAFWLVSSLRPRVFFELCTHTGVSYFAFCQAVAAERMPTRCFAVDTWCGDAHAGFYGREVFAAVTAFNSRHFRDFSTLMRMRFDVAVKHSGPRGIDLLHIDGLHTLRAVRHDFETWLPLMSRRAVVLLHDTRITTKGFGVRRLWRRISARYPSIEFPHAFGLGAAAIGDAPPREFLQLCAAATAERALVLRFFAALGQRLVALNALDAERPTV